MKKYVLSILLSSFLVTFAQAHQHENSVVPAADLAAASEMGFDGPSETTGIEYVKAHGLISLGTEFSGMEGYVMRMREISLAPGGQVAVHQHNSRPGIAYILEGEAVEHRSDEAEPQIRKSGDAAVEASGVIHWWVNKGTESARVLVVDIVKEEDAG
jgi:quercetin dioxygenase-like cupin family protein